MMTSLKQSCSDARHAFALRDAGMEALAAADASATAKLRQAAALFYRCGQREEDPYMKETFMAYYARTLFQVGRSATDARATSLAVDEARRLESSRFDDVRGLVANARPAPTHASAPAPIATSAAVHTVAYCTNIAPNLASTLTTMRSAVSAAIDAGNNDTPVLATTTLRYGGAFKQVEDDYQSIQSELDIAGNSLAVARRDKRSLTVRTYRGARVDSSDQQYDGVHLNVQSPRISF